MKYTKKSIMQIARDNSKTVRKRMDELIQVGLDELKLELGIISHIEDKTYTVKYSNNDDLVGQQFELGNTYCSITLDAIDPRMLNVIAFENFSQSDYSNHPAYEAFQLEAYIGSPISMINLNKPYGTINFTQPAGRDSNFTLDEKELVDWLSSAVSYLLTKAGTTGTLNLRQE